MDFIPIRHAIIAFEYLWAHGINSSNIMSKLNERNKSASPTKFLQTTITTFDFYYSQIRLLNACFLNHSFFSL